MDQLVFNVYQTTNLMVPMRQWTVATNVTTTSCSLPILPGAYFFTVSVSNTVTGLETFMN
jgi:hypothetical protein